jgi:hypothetical protein
MVQRKLSRRSSSRRIPAGLADVFLRDLILVVYTQTKSVLPTKANITLNHETVFFLPATVAVDDFFCRQVF